MKRKLAVAVLSLFFLGVAVFSGYEIVRILAEYRAGENAYDEVQQHIHIPPSEPTQATENTKPIVITEELSEEPAEEIETEPPKPNIVFPEVDFDALREVNEDVVGWLYIEGTNINYPVVQGEDNKEYLNKLFDGEYNGAGSIFMDCRNSPDLSESNTILYGHNMKNKTMFSELRNYLKQETYDAYPIGLYITPEGNYWFEMVAGLVSHATGPSWQLDFDSEEEVLQWIQDAMAHSSFTSTTVPELGDKVITLSTCTYEFQNARFVLVGILNEY